MRTAIRVTSALVGLSFLFLWSPLAHAELQLSVHSSAFSDGKAIPQKYTCSGEDISPPLEWEGTPAPAKSIALIVSDPDAPSGTFYHWVLYDMPPRANRLGENIDKKPVVGGGGLQGKSDAGSYGYKGPCPPPGSPHHYHFKVFALDSSLNLPAGANAEEIQNAMNGHVLASGDLVATFER